VPVGILPGSREVNRSPALAASCTAERNTVHPTVREASTKVQALGWRAALLEGFGVLTRVQGAFGMDATRANRGDRFREAGCLGALGVEVATTRSRFEKYRSSLEGVLDTHDHARPVSVIADGRVTPKSIRDWIRSAGAFYLEPPEQAALSEIGLCRTSPSIPVHTTWGMTCPGTMG
jgi:hypothetical protein